MNNKTVNVDFVARAIEIDLDGKEHFIAAALAAEQAIKAKEGAELVAPEYDKAKNVLDNIVTYTDTAKAQADIATTKAAEAVVSADIATQKAAEAGAKAEESANSANASKVSAAEAQTAKTSVDATAKQLTDFIATKETLTAPAVDKSLTIEGAAADSKVVGELKKTHDELYDDLYVYGLTKQDGYLTAEGRYVDTANCHSISTTMFKVTAGQKIRYKGNGEMLAMSALYFDTEKNIVSSLRINSSVDFTDVDVPSGVSYAIFSSYAKKPSKVIFELDLADADTGDIRILKRDVAHCNEQLINSVKLQTEPIDKNLWNPIKNEKGYIQNGNIVSSENHITSDYIPVTPRLTYVKHVNPRELGGGVNAIYAYSDTNMSSFIEIFSGVKLTDNGEWCKFTIRKENIAYIRVMSSSGDEAQNYVGLGDKILDSIPAWQPYKKIEKDVYIDNKQVLNQIIDDSLNGKVWYVIGDSATEGDFSSINQPNIADGLYAGQKPVYPYFIGNRTGMIVHNIAKCGAVLARIPTDSSRTQWAVEGNYDKLVGSDADYITIWIGANDMWQRVPLGTIDSQDDTTFCGAYNKILTYYINKYPNTKLGLVASFWCTEPYAMAVVNVGKKYGIPVLNLYNDDRLPVTVGSQRPDVHSAIKRLRNSQWVVSATNSHPSAKYHEIESYFIENWLRSL